MEAGDVMTLGAAAVRRDTPLPEALQVMLDHRVSGLPVVDSDGTLVGVLSEGDFLRDRGSRGRPVEALIAGGHGARNLDTRTVAEIMTSDPVAIAADTPLEEAIRLMEQHQVKRLPVVKDGKVVGILSRADLLLGLLRKYRMA